MVHQLIGQFDRRHIDPADNIFWRTGGNSGLQYDIGCFIGGVLARG